MLEGSAIDLLLGLLAVVLLTLGTAFFVGIEFALVAIDRSKVEALAESGNRRASTIVRALRSLSFELSGAQLGITVTSLLVGYIAEPAIAEGISPLLADIGLPEDSSLEVAVVLALTFATAVQMVLGELVPKNIAIAKSLETAGVLAPPSMLLNRLLRPLILMLNGAANWTVRLLGIEPADEINLVRSLDELELLIYASRREGSLQKEEFDLLARSISFATKTAADALVPRVAIESLPSIATVGELERVALESGHSRFPVIGEDLDDIVGVAVLKDTFELPYDERSSTPILRIVQQPFVVPESRDLESLLLEMRRDRHQIAIVVDEYGGTAGIITIEDLLEEIVGDIEDEYDPDAPVAEVTQAPIEGVHVVSGMLHGDELRDATGFEMPDGDYETLAGFLLSLFDRIPSAGDHVSYADWEFKVIEMEGRRIAKVLVVAPSSREGAG